ncbi:MAG: thymidine phosphorylase, partial [Planktomarina sp.]
LLAACGASVPMVSGRGLGHTGGTLDKLEAIPGVKTNLSQARFQTVVENIGCAIVAATPQIAPADARLYAIRDVSGTVRSFDLITASILSKKLAAGIGTLVLDVKTGSGATMPDIDDSKALAKSLVDVATAAGCPTTALITDMNQPLLPAIGNAVEIAAVMDAFTTGQGRMVDVAIALGAQLLKEAKVTYTLEGGEETLRNALQSGAGLDVFARMIMAQGGPDNFTTCPQDYLTIAPGFPVLAPASGYVTQMNGKALGQICVSLGAGRAAPGDVVDHSVGLSNIVPLGAYVQAGQPLAVLHAYDDSAAASVAQCFTIEDTPAEIPPLIYEVIRP